MPRKKKTPTLTPLPEAAHEVTKVLTPLEAMLFYSGMDKLHMRAILYDIGIHDPSTAYNFLRSQDRIPDMGYAAFKPLYEELMQP